MAETKQKFRCFNTNFAAFTKKYFYGAEFLEGTDFTNEDLNDFNNLPTSMQWGVFEDFFEKCGVYPEVKDCHGHEVFAIDEVDRYHATCCVRGGSYIALLFTNDKEQARLEALDKAIELYETTETLKYQ